MEKSDGLFFHEIMIPSCHLVTYLHFFSLLCFNAKYECNLHSLEMCIKYPCTIPAMNVKKSCVRGV